MRPNRRRRGAASLRVGIRHRVTGAHDDLQLELGDFRHRCCSCNLLVDDTLTHQTDAFGALARFLQLWIDELDKLCQRPGGTFLPFDFDDPDQGSCWLRVYSGDTVEATLVAGERSIDGISLKASDFAAYVRDDFRPWTAWTLTCDLNDLIATIAENLKEPAARRHFFPSST